MKSKFIVLKDFFTECPTSDSNEGSDRYLAVGEMVEECSADLPSYQDLVHEGAIAVRYISDGEYHPVFIVPPEKRNSSAYLKSLNEDEYELLLGVPIADRVRLLSDSSRLSNALQLGKGNMVMVSLSDDKKDLPGKIEEKIRDPRTRALTFSVALIPTKKRLVCHAGQLVLRYRNVEPSSSNLPPSDAMSRGSSNSMFADLDVPVRCSSESGDYTNKSGSSGSSRHKSSRSGSGNHDYPTSPTTETVISKVNPFEEYCREGLVQPNDKVFLQQYGEMSAELREHYLGKQIIIPHVTGGGSDRGLVRWCGNIRSYEGIPFVGLKMETARTCFNHGTLDHVTFNAHPRRGLFVPLAMVKEDGSGALYVLLDCPDDTEVDPDKLFGSKDSGVVEGAIRPEHYEKDEVDALQAKVCGEQLGIQGYNNSCYIDSTLAALFTFNQSCDSLLFRPKRADDISEYDAVQRIVRDEIVNPLRLKKYVRSDRMQKLRGALSEVTKDDSWLSAEKEGLEAFDVLFSKILKKEKLIVYTNGVSNNWYTILIEPDKDKFSGGLPTVQQLFHRSYLRQKLKFKQPPRCLIIQMPRDKKTKVYDRIIPSLELDITCAVENAARSCGGRSSCKNQAEFECFECFPDIKDPDNLVFCKDCDNRRHGGLVGTLSLPFDPGSHLARSSHKREHLKLQPSSPTRGSGSKERALRVGERELMELYAVVCIERCHYVAFIKTGEEPDSPWVFTDSMAFTQSEGTVPRNIQYPQMSYCPGVSYWLSAEGVARDCFYCFYECPAQRGYI